jgi:N-acetylmuramoyl-L-alanine amidase
VEVRLGYAPQSINDQPFVHALDIHKTIGPLLSGSPLGFSGQGRTIVLDAGHGGEDPGTKSAIGPEREKDLTLDWARRLRALLVAQGWIVYLTRSNDTDLALSNRVAVADRHNADLFLSLHFNSAGTNRSEFGLETYCLTPLGMPSATSREFGDDLSSRYPNNAFDEQNLRLACQVHRALVGLGGAHDRGVRRARYLGVLRGQQRPAILVEGGYLSNPHEARLITDSAYRQKLAAAVAAALQPCIEQALRAQVQGGAVPASRPSGSPSAAIKGS